MEFQLQAPSGNWHRSYNLFVGITPRDLRTQHSVALNDGGQSQLGNNRAGYAVELTPWLHIPPGTHLPVYKHGVLTGEVFFPLGPPPMLIRLWCSPAKAKLTLSTNAGRTVDIPLLACDTTTDFVFQLDKTCRCLPPEDCECGDLGAVEVVVS